MDLKKNTILGSFSCGQKYKNNLYMKPGWKRPKKKTVSIF